MWPVNNVIPLVSPVILLKQGEVFSLYFMSIQLEITNVRLRVRSFCPSSELLVLLSEVLLLLFVGFNFKMSLKTSVDSYHVPPPKRIYITAPDTNLYVISKTEFCAYIVQNTVLIHVPYTRRYVYQFVYSQHFLIDCIHLFLSLEREKELE